MRIERAGWYILHEHEFTQEPTFFSDNEQATPDEILSDAKQIHPTTRKVIWKNPNGEDELRIPNIDPRALGYKRKKRRR